MTIALIIIITILVFVAGYFFGQQHYVKPDLDLLDVPLQTSPDQVRDFYNTYNDKFIKVYGEVIQAFRTTKVEKLLDYQIESIGLEEGQKVLDAGCGVCGPAAYFAKQKKVDIDALTISEVQAEEGKLLLQRENITNQVNITLGDFHQLPKYFKTSSYDIVYFLESFGHASKPEKVLAGAWDVLKPGGTLYIKDLFRKIAALPGHQKKIDETIDTINAAYRYNIPDLYRVLHEVRKLGFVIVALKTIDIKLEDFENLTISNDFQELTGIATIDNWENYIFPVEFYELKCYKPVHNLANGTDKYFLQNMLYMQLQGMKEEVL